MGRGEMVVEVLIEKKFHYEKICVL